MKTFFKDHMIAEEVCRFIDFLVSQNVPWERIRVVPNNRGNYIVFYQASVKLH